MRTHGEPLLWLETEEGWKNWEYQVSTAQTGKSKKGRREVCRNMVGKQANVKPGLSFQILPWHDNVGTMKFTIRPLTPSLWPALEALFGKSGASNGCWCMYWRIGPEYHKRPREKNKSALRRIVNQGPPPGLLAFDGKQPVGWCQLTPRQDLNWLNRKQALQPVDDVPTWAVSCFYVRRGYRRRGVMAALIVEALKAAKRANALALEAYPVDTARPGCTSNVFTGTASTFRRLGFRTVARRLPSRPIMRHDLRGITP